MTASLDAGHRSMGSGTFRLLFRAMLVAWLVLPFALFGQDGQDAAALLTAGDLVSDHPEAVYQGDEASAVSSPTYRDSFCAIHPPVPNCDFVLLVFSSPPPAVPVLAIFQLPSADVAVLLVRLAGTAALVVGMEVLWRRLASRSPMAPRALALTAALLTPFTFHHVGLGQNTSLLFLLACLGISASTRDPRAAFTGILWSLSVAFKAFPAALGALLLAERRVRALAWGTATLAALIFLAWVPGGSVLFRGYVDQLGTNSSARIMDPANGSFSRLLHDLTPSLSGTEGLTPGFVVLRVILVVPLLLALTRMCQPDTRWAFAHLALLVVFPLVTWHYLWLAVASVSVALAERPRTPRTMLILPLMGGLLSAGAIVQMRWGYTAWIQAPLLLAAVAATVVLASLRPSERSASRERGVLPAEGR